MVSLITACLALLTLLVLEFIYLSPGLTDNTPFTTTALGIMAAAKTTTCAAQQQQQQQQQWQLATQSTLDTYAFTFGHWAYSFIHNMQMNPVASTVIINFQPFYRKLS